MNRGLFIDLVRGTILSCLLLLALACHVPTLDQLNYTRKEPKKSDLFGNWLPDKSSLRVMESGGGYDTSVQPKLIRFVFALADTLTLSLDLRRF